MKQTYKIIWGKLNICNDILFEFNNSKYFDHFLKQFNYYKANGGNSEKLKSMRKKAPKIKPTSSKKPLEIVSRKDKYTVVYIDENLPPRVTFSLAEGMKMFLPRPREELNVQFLPKTI